MGATLGVVVGVGVGDGVGVEALMFPTCIVFAKVLSPIAPEVNVGSVVDKTRKLFTYSVILVP